MPRKTTASSNGTAATEAPANSPADNTSTSIPAQPAPVGAPKADTKPEAAPAAPAANAPAPAPESSDDIVTRSYGSIVDEPGDFAPVTAAIRQLTSRELRTLLTMLESKHAEARFKAQDPTFKSYRRALHAVAAQLAAELDARYGVRRDTTKDEGHGLYAEAGPLGTIGLGVGHVHKRRLSNGAVKSQHNGIGFYFRAGAITKLEVTSGNRLHELARRAKEMHQAKAAAEPTAATAAA